MSTISGLTYLGYNSPSMSAVAPPVFQTFIPGLAQTAVSLSTQGGIVATLVGAPAPVTYDAVGLLNAIVQAGTETQPVLATSGGSSSQSTVQNLVNQDVVNTLTSTPATSGIYTASGSITGLSSNASANWASLLKTNPSLASRVISDSFNQGIVGTLSTTA